MKGTLLTKTLKESTRFEDKDDDLWNDSLEDYEYAWQYQNNQ